MSRNRILAISGTAIMVLMAVSFTKSCKQTAIFNPCQLGGSKKMRVVYILSTRSGKTGKNAGCSSCDSGNQDQWKALHKIYGGRDEFEFVVVFPDETTKQKSLNIPYDTGLVINKAKIIDRDEFIICRRAEKVLEQRGRIDMKFMREANAILAMAHLD